jgi:alcohol dehydrogenase
MLRTDLRFGAGEAGKLPDHVRAFGWTHLALVVDPGPAATSAWQDIEAALANEFTVVAKHTLTMAEPTYDYLDEARRPFMDQRIDAFIVVGGGSALDAGKALSLLVTNRAPAIEYRGFNLAKTPGPPVIAIPTTAGTASEVTPNAVFTDTREQRKFGINTDLYIPKLVILDPVLTLSCPRHVTISSGMDAVVHAHESFVSRRATPITRMLSVEAFRLLANALPRVVASPQDLEERGRVLLGSYLAGTALFNSSAGPAGAMSYPLGVHQKVPHGLAGAVFLPYVIRHNVQHGYAGYSALYAQIDGVPPVPDASEASRLFASWMWDLTGAFDIPRTLDGFGFRRGDIERFIAQAQLLKGAFDMNPVPFTMEDVRALLETMATTS